jgi:threonine dehydrogenase-like Zn-dependent dehydrogenase
MTTAPAVPAIQREPGLPGQTVVVIGGSAGIGLETARRARAEGASVVLTGRNPGRLERAAAELGALRRAAFDATDPAALERFFGDLPKPIDHVMVTAGRPYYGRLADIDVEQARRSLDEQRRQENACRPGRSSRTSGPSSLMERHRAPICRRGPFGASAWSIKSCRGRGRNSSRCRGSKSRPTFTA